MRLLRHAHIWRRSLKNAAREEWDEQPVWKTSESDLRTRTKQLGAKENVRRRKCDVRFSVTRRNRVFQKNYMRFGVEKLLQVGLVPARLWRGKPRALRQQKD